jgi:hypothetical protein
LKHERQLHEQWLVRSEGQVNSAWFLIVLLGLIIGATFPEKITDLVKIQWVTDNSSVISTWSTRGLFLLLFWSISIAWERSRIPFIKLNKLVRDERSKRFDLRIGSTENEQLEVRAYVTKIEEKHDSRWVETSDVIAKVELNWREITKGQRPIITKDIPQTVGFTAWLDPPNEPGVYLDGVGAAFPLKCNRRSRITVVVEFYKLPTSDSSTKEDKEVSARAEKKESKVSILTASKSFRFLVSPATDSMKYSVIRNKPWGRIWSLKNPDKSSASVSDNRCLLESCEQTAANVTNKGKLLVSTSGATIQMVIPNAIAENNVT